MISVLHYSLTSLFCLLFASMVMGQQKEVKVFAHRGGAYEYDENTLSAFEESYRQGIRGFELDIKLTKDGHLVILHDNSLKRTVGPDMPIEELSLAEVQELKTKKGNPIPTLDEILAFLEDKPGLYVEFEMKTANPKYDEKSLSAYCDQLYTKVYASVPQESEYVLTSFDERPLKYLKANYPEAELMFIKSEGLSQGILDEVKAMGISRVGCRIEGTTRNMMNEAKKQQIKVTLWPGRTVEDFLLGVTLGADYLCTDIPVEVMNWVKGNASWIIIK